MQSSPKPLNKPNLAVDEISTEEIADRLRASQNRIASLEAELYEELARRDALMRVLEEFEAVKDAAVSDVAAIRGKSLRGALVALAERHAGYLNSADARRALAATGKHVTPNRLWRELALIGRFKKVSHGTYVLLPAEPTTANLFSSDSD